MMHDESQPIDYTGFFSNEGASPMADELSLIEKETYKNVYFQVTAV